MFKPGLICRKTAGQEKGRVCIVLDVKDNLAVIDGYVKKRGCNIRHLEPLAATELPKNASHEDVLGLLEASGFKNGGADRKKRAMKERWKLLEKASAKT